MWPLFKKKNNLDVHRRENCTSTNHAEVPKMKCPVCCNPYTYNGLRSHLGQFATMQDDQRIVRGEHAKLTPNEHQIILDDIKAKYKLKKH